MKRSKLQLLLVALLLLSANAFCQTDATKTEFKPSGKLGGYAFGDFMYKGNTNSFGQSNTQYASTAKDFTSFECRRIYVEYDYNISPKFTSQFLVAYEGGKNTLSDGTRALYIKYANLRWKNIFHNSDLVMGAQSTPTFAMTSEPVWGYRSLEKTIMDMRKIGGSNDVGVSLQGKLNDEGTFGYTLMIGNGTGAVATTSKFKKFYGDVYTKLFDKKLLVDVGADNQWYQAKPYVKSKTTLKAFLAYQTGNFTLGLEGFQQIQKNFTVYADKTTANAVVSGISIFTHGKFSKKWGYVARYDHYNPDTKFDSNKSYSTTAPYFNESFFLAGLDYMPVNKVHIMPNIWVDNYKNRDTAANGLSSSSSDLALRLTLYYIFK